MKVKKEVTRRSLSQYVVGGLRVPAIIEWPERIKTPRITQVPGNTVDIYPTILDLIGLHPVNQPVLDGISLVPVINGRSDRRPIPMGFWQFNASGIGTPHDKWMREELAAQRAGRAYHDAARLVADAAQIKTTYARDQHSGHAAWLDWPWKLHHIEGGKRQPGKVTIELYNLEDDPMESKNLAAQYPQRVETMCRDLDEWMDSVIDSLNGNDYR